MTTKTTPCPCLAELAVLVALYEADPLAPTMDSSACGFCWTSRTHDDHCLRCGGSGLALNHVLVAWCRQCEHYLPIDEAGTPCPGCDWILLKRRRYICYECEELNSSATRYDYDKHQEVIHDH